ncbi:MAG TPA: rhodanese-like domain-containing protein [Solirubrobacterales bacterium]|nr:rhodanese-like domain-containing protein [Solirubrobacterales bacterium]
MFERIDYQGLRRLLDQDAQLVEVLPAEEYAEEHLPGAINIPLKELDANSAAKLDETRPVVVYCWDYLCDMSPRAAARLASLGFERVYDYASSKVDYLARGLPREGEKASETRAVDLLRDDFVRCRLHDPLDRVRVEVEASRYGFALVLDDDEVLLGRLRRAALEGDGTTEQVMEAGPSTIRADTSIEKLRERLEGRGLNFAIVTTPDGVLMGIVCRADLPAA